MRFHLEDRLESDDRHMQENAEHVYKLKPKRHYVKTIGLTLFLVGTIGFGAYRLNEHMKEKKQQEDPRIEWDDVSA